MQGSNPHHGVHCQRLTTDAPQLAPQGPRWPLEVEEIALAWAGLPEALKAAVLGIVRSVVPAEAGAGPSRNEDGSRKSAAAPLSLGGRARG